MSEIDPIEQLKRRAEAARSRIDREVKAEYLATLAKNELDRQLKNFAASFSADFDAVVQELNDALAPSDFEIEVKDRIMIAAVGSICELQANLAIMGGQGKCNTLAFAVHRTERVFSQHFGPTDIGFPYEAVPFDQAGKDWIRERLIAFLDACLPPV